jgi:uncharacterized DUF497 family protein
MAKYHDRFCGDERKEEANRKKHRVSFRTASEVLGDDRADVFHLEEYDVEHSIREHRYITIGSHPDDRHVVLWICWTRRSGTTRIIGARPATRGERDRHAEKVGQAHGL